MFGQKREKFKASKELPRYENSTPPLFWIQKLVKVQDGMVINTQYNVSLTYGPFPLNPQDIRKFRFPSPPGLDSHFEISALHIDDPHKPKPVLKNEEEVTRYIEARVREIRSYYNNPNLPYNIRQHGEIIESIEHHPESGDFFPNLEDTLEQRLSQQLVPK